ncbi:heparan-alpha-glucosaminide N-acetyltransferase isoform X1 [Triplophysa rosa]|uniref:Heparan-alpha-glucosaminide N-acetyltransferase n=2 Tax=Triplophysa rosa TaxID=992332 RepID=A0A9W8C8R6_TRIRA|nr:heparan-alpha-glucosaminide N-acetyltransferase isoform X1 [Triplophysa rosa]KAI7811150.1 putative heparan-alpha-glucosaminide N-acetyltransferase [Triplophysa rosa]
MQKRNTLDLKKEDRKEEAGKSDVMASEGECRWTVSAVIVLLLAVSAAHVTNKPASSRPHRKTSVLKMDEAALSVSNEIKDEIILYVLSDHCYQCLPQQLGSVPAGQGPGTPTTVGFVVGTQHALTLHLNSKSANQELCKVDFHFGEQGNYSLWVKNLIEPSRVSCNIVTDSEPVNSYLPILFAFLVFAGLAALYTIWSTVRRLDFVRNLLLRLGSTVETERLINSELGIPNRLGVTASTESIIPATAERRLRSLDTFRGLALVIMVFVNYGGGRYWFFRHESWNGLTVADLVFPWFVFIMGTSVGLSLSGSLRRGVKRTHLLGKIFWRGLQLFLIGVIIINPNYCQGPLSWDSLRIPGVLQRLSFTYLVVAGLDVVVAQDQLTNLSSETRWYSLHDVFLYWPAWLCVIALEIVWLCLTFLLPVPGCPTGYLGPGGIGDFNQYPSCTGGAAGYIDRWLLGENHIYQTPSSRVVYQTSVPFDPEGVLGSINSILMAFLGLQAGKILLHYRDQHRQIITRFLIWGFMLGILSAILTKCSSNKGFIPVNKNLWSFSYVTTLSCFAFVVLKIFYYMIDVKKWWSGAPFFYPGMNSILVYVGHEVFEEYFPFRWKMSNNQSHAEHLTQNLLATSIWVFIAYLLYRKKIFWKI